MEGVIAGLVVLLVFSLAAWFMLRRMDPPYRGVHEPRGRHRARDWEARGEGDEPCR